MRHFMVRPEQPTKLINLMLLLAGWPGFPGGEPLGVLLEQVYTEIARIKDPAKASRQRHGPLSPTVQAHIIPEIGADLTVDVPRDAR